MARYVIWDKKSNVYTPVGECFTAEQWLERYPIAKLDSVKLVLSGSEINGAHVDTLNWLLDNYKKLGCDFSACTTDEEKLEAIESFEDEMNAVVEDDEPTAEERIAAALEYQVMASLPDEEEE